MADIDLLPTRGVPFAALVDSTGVATNGSSTVAQLAAKGMRAIAAVDPTGLALDGTSKVADLAARGIRASFAPIDELGVSTDDAVSTADAIRKRGIRPMVAVDANGVSQTGSATIPILAQRGLGYFCPLDESGNATSLVPVPPNTIRAEARHIHADRRDHDADRGLYDAGRHGCDLSYRSRHDAIEATAWLVHAD